MRLFAGIEIPDDIKQRLDDLIARLRPSANLKWSPTDNLHVTTKFIGEWPQSRLDEMAFALRDVTGTGPIPIAVRGLGWFPNPHNPRVFWAGVHGPAELAELAAASETVLERLGIAKENRPFSPHLTLARIKPPANVAGLRRAVANLPTDDFGSFTADRFHLYLSEPGAGGSVYTKLYDFPLAAA